MSFNCWIISQILLGISDKNLKKQVKGLSDNLKIPKPFQSHGLGQRLVGALIGISAPYAKLEDSILVKSESDSLPPSNGVMESPSKKPTSARSKLSFDDRLKQELKFLNLNDCTLADLSKKESRADDMVSASIRKCHSILNSNSAQNSSFKEKLLESSLPLVEARSKVAKLKKAETKFQKLFLNPKTSPTDLESALKELKAAELDILEFKAQFGEIASGYVARLEDFSGYPRAAAEM